jgi:hypothetical protein
MSDHPPAVGWQNESRIKVAPIIKVAPCPMRSPGRGRVTHEVTRPTGQMTAFRAGCWCRQWLKFEDWWQLRIMQLFFCPPSRQRPHPLHPHSLCAGELLCSHPPSSAAYQPCLFPVAPWQPCLWAAAPLHHAGALGPRRMAVFISMYLLQQSSTAAPGGPATFCPPVGDLWLPPQGPRGPPASSAL